MSAQLPRPVEQLIAAIDVETPMNAAEIRQIITDGTRRGLRPLRALYQAGVQVEIIERAAWAHRGYEFVAVTPENVERDLIEQIDLRLCTRLRAMPIRREAEGKVLVAFADPDDIEALDVMNRRFGNRMRVAVADARQILSSILALDNVDAFGSSGLEEEEEAPTPDGPAGGEDGKVAQMATALLQRAITSRASDVHLEPLAKDMQVRYRIDGVMQALAKYSPTDARALVNRYKIIGGLDVGERRVPQDGRFSVQIEGRSVDLRLATMPTVWGYEGAVIRILARSDDIATLEALGLDPPEYERLAKLVDLHHGAVLTTGPTGSGKTTTLYAALDRVAKPTKKVLTVEDPVELRIPGITQVQVNNKAGLTFARALRAFLRSDPDIIMVGEIRDTETAKTAIEAAQTGHLVLATLHANTAPEAPARLIEMGVESYLVSNAVKGIFSQRLVRKLCEHCRIEQAITPDLVAEPWPGGEVPERVYSANLRGCQRCTAGYKGRMLLCEVMTVTEKIGRMIVDHAQSSEIENAAIEEGFRPMRIVGLGKVAKGLTSMEEVLMVTSTAF